jgi:hypothetical protein
VADRTQTYANHAQIVPMYHYVTFGLLLVTFIGACVNLYESLGDQSRLYSASLLVTLTLATLFVFFLMRVFALKAQDRAIRAEEHLRHYVLTGSLLDPRLTIRQIVGLRFAADDELAALAKRAADEGLAPDDIKKAVRAWRADTHRV